MQHMAGLYPMRTVFERLLLALMGRPGPGSTPLDAWSRLIIMIFYGFVKIRITRAKKAKIEEEHYHEQPRNKK